MHKTKISFGDREVGTITTDDGESVFRYCESWIDDCKSFPISMSIPLTMEDIPHEKILTWLYGLLPEGQPLVTLGRVVGRSPDDVLGLLSRVGRDTAGAMSIGSIRQSLPLPRNARPVTTTDLMALLNELPERPLLAGKDGIAISLSGVQEKLPIIMRDGEMFLPRRETASTHIIKPAPRLAFSGSAHNEAACLVLARRVGLSAAPVTTGIAGDRIYCLIERYDRVCAGDAVARIHQEDFCQALGRLPTFKYERNGSGVRGISVADMVRFARTVMPRPEVDALLRGVIFNVLIANTDAHAKNFSMLIEPGGARVAPLYDMACTDVWPSVTENLALDIGGKNRGKHLKDRHWRRMAEECGIDQDRIIDMVRDLADAIPRALPGAIQEVAAMPAGHHGVLDDMRERIIERCHHITTGLESAPKVDVSHGRPPASRRSPRP